MKTSALILLTLLSVSSITFLPLAASARTANKPVFQEYSYTYGPTITTATTVTSTSPVSVDDSTISLTVNQSPSGIEVSYVNKNPSNYLDAGVIYALGTLGSFQSLSVDNSTTVGVNLIFQVSSNYFLGEGSTGYLGAYTQRTWPFTTATSLVMDPSSGCTLNPHNNKVTIAELQAGACSSEGITSSTIIGFWVGVGTFLSLYGGPSSWKSSGSVSISSITYNGVTTTLTETPPVRSNPPIPPSGSPSVLTLTTYGGQTVIGHFVNKIGTGEVIYNVPSINQATLDADLANGDFSLFPLSITYCSTTVNGAAEIEVSGFTSLSWGNPGLNSTEFILGGFTSFTTSAVGWPASTPACGT